MQRDPSSNPMPVDAASRGWTYRCTICGHWFSAHGHDGCRQANHEAEELCACPETNDALLASYGPPFAAPSVRGRYARHLQRYRRRDDPWVIMMRELFAALRAQDHKPPALLLPLPYF
jgi:hypothetical protein